MINLTIWSKIQSLTPTINQVSDMVIGLRLTGELVTPEVMDAAMNFDPIGAIDAMIASAQGFQQEQLMDLLRDWGKLKLGQAVVGFVVGFVKGDM